MRPDEARARCRDTGALLNAHGVHRTEVRRQVTGYDPSWWEAVDALGGDFQRALSYVLAGYDRAQKKRTRS